nr:G protein-coupled receptor [Proales similis]
MLNETVEFLNESILEGAQPSRLGSALGAIVAFAFIILGIFGDSLIIIAILSKQELRNNIVNIFIVSLQLNDIFNIGFNQFLVGLSYSFMEWQGTQLCEVFVYTSIICTGSLLWHHGLISIHRFLVVVCNQHVSYMRMSPKVYCVLSLVLARLIPIAVCLPALINRNMTVYSRAALRCLLAPEVGRMQNLLIVLFNILIPSLIVCFCFAQIFARVHTVSRNVRKALGGRANPKRREISFRRESARTPAIANGDTTEQIMLCTSTQASSSFSLRREIQISKMFAIIFTVFFFGYMPYGVIRLIDKKNNLHPDVYVLLTVLFIISISVSPIIYGLMNTQIRVQCIYLLSKLFRMRPREASPVQRKPMVVKPTVLPRESTDYSDELEMKNIANASDRSVKEKPSKLSKKSEKSVSESKKSQRESSQATAAPAAEMQAAQDDGGVYKGP